MTAGTFRTAPLLLILLLTSCQLLNPEPHQWKDETQILVVIPQHQFATIATGSRRYVHSGQYSQIPVHVRAEIDRLSRTYNLVERNGWSIRSINAYCGVFSIRDYQDLDELVKTIDDDSRVLFAQPMNLFKSLVSATGRRLKDPYAEIQYGEGVKHLLRLHHYTQGEDVKIAMVDSAVDGRHPDLTGQVKVTVSFVKAHQLTDQLHGTAVAGIISAQADNGEGGLGIAPAAKLHAYSACRHDGESGAICNSFDLARAVAAVVDDGIDILNLSLAGPRDPLLELLLTEAMRRNTIVIASQNTEQPQNSFPASMAGVFAVGKGARANTSPIINKPRGNWYLLDERLSTRAGGGYQYFYGNSIASAGVSGLAVLIRSRYSPANTRQWLEAATTGDCNLLPEFEETSGLSGALITAIGCNSMVTMGNRLSSHLDQRLPL